MSFDWDLGGDGCHRLSVAEAYADREFHRLGRDLSALAEPLQTVLLVCACQGYSDVNGLSGFLEVEFFGGVDYALFVRAFRRIGASRQAECLAAALERFPFDAPHRRNSARYEFLCSHPDLFEDEHDQICGADEDTYALLLRYVRAHVEAFSWDYPSPIGPRKAWLP